MKTRWIKNIECNLLIPNACIRAFKKTPAIYVSISLMHSNTYMVFCPGRTCVSSVSIVIWYYMCVLKGRINSLKKSVWGILSCIFPITDMLFLVWKEAAENKEFQRITQSRFIFFCLSHGLKESPPLLLWKALLYLITHFSCHPWLWKETSKTWKRR